MGRDNRRNEVISFSYTKTTQKEKGKNMLLKNDYRISEVVRRFDKYEPKKLRNVLKKIIQGKLYKSIVNEIMSSTTIENIV
jgi:hypothetical protein